MNNNLYQWHDDFMVQQEMREVQRNMEQNRMLKEAGIIGDSWLVRAVKALGKWIAGIRHQEEQAIEVQAHSWKSDTIA